MKQMLVAAVALAILMFGGAFTPLSSAIVSPVPYPGAVLVSVDGGSISILSTPLLQCSLDSWTGASFIVHCGRDVTATGDLPGLQAATQECRNPTVTVEGTGSGTINGNVKCGTADDGCSATVSGTGTCSRTAIGTGNLPWECKGWVTGTVPRWSVSCANDP